MIVLFALLASDPTPEPEDVKAGWVAFAVFIGLALAVALIGWFLTRSLRRSRETAESGGYGETRPRGAASGPVPPTGDRPRDDTGEPGRTD